jgi:hypothetical protein
LDGVILTYGQNYFESGKIFISIKGQKYLSICTVWFESDLSAQDLYSFETEYVNKIEHGNKKTIFSFFNLDTISSIEIYEKTVETDDEELVFDSAILVQRSDGKRLYICGGESAFRNVYLYSEESVIKSQLKCVKLRKTIA